MEIQMHPVKQNIKSWTQTHVEVFDEIAKGTFAGDANQEVLKDLEKEYLIQYLHGDYIVPLIVLTEWSNKQSEV